MKDLFIFFIIIILSASIIEEASWLETGKQPIRTSKSVKRVLIFNIVLLVVGIIALCT
jgi:hypothetical protein